MSTYTGRFAPTPSGPLHHGSLLTALASFLDAKANKGFWRLRMDDLDGPRNVSGAADSILRSLEQHGLLWDGKVLYQSDRIEAYQTAMRSLVERQKVFPCRCTRKLLIDQTIYPGTCSHQPMPHLLIPPSKPLDSTESPQAYSVRVKVNKATVQFDDQLQGAFTHRLAEECGDFIVFRRDGIYAYHFAVVVDDDFQNINHIMRGADLLPSTARQIFLSQLLGLKLPAYGHIPVILDDRGHKLSKRSQAVPISASKPALNLCQSLLRLGQNPPLELRCQSVSSVIQWGIENWRRNRIPRITQLEDRLMPETNSRNTHND